MTAVPSAQWARASRAAMVVVAVAGLLWTWLSRPQGDAGDLLRASTRVGAPAPAFTLAAPEGRQISLAGLKGKAVVLNFWASWCPPCRAEMGALDQAQRDYADRGVVVLGVNQMEAEAVATAFMREQSLTFPIALDADGAVSQQYRASALPTTYFIDGDGVIRDIVYGGPMTRALIESKLATLAGK
jgi:cytochrome c biogenesis protein CcmG, thiol:disulfide interchange protein DsbE